MLEFARELQYNIKQEAQATEDYTNLLMTLEKSNLPNKDEIKSVINEIISDELNHNEKLNAVYTAITGIKPNID